MTAPIPGHPIVWFVLLSGMLASCGPKEAARGRTPVDLNVTVTSGVISAPDSVEPGWARVRVEEDGAGHIIVIYRLPAPAGDSDVAHFVGALDTDPGTPKPGVAIGGPEMGDVGEVVVHLTPGRYVLACVRRGEDGHRHTAAGESKAFVVVDRPVDARRATPPTATQEIRLVDFAYVGPGTWRAGSHLLRIENTGLQDHQVRLVRLRAGSTLKDWMSAADPDTLATPIAGMARVGPGQVAYLPAELSPGTYVAYCLVPDVASGKPHVAFGMMRTIQVQ